MGAATLVAGAALLVLAWKKAPRTMESYGLAFFLTFWIVTSNLIVPIGTAQADRLFYLPLLGLLAAAAAFLHRVLDHRRGTIVARALLCIAIALGAIGSTARTRVWKDERTLFESAVRDEPRGVKARWNLAVVLQREEGDRAARRVLEILAPVAKWAPNHGEYLHRQAVAYMFLGEGAAADSLFHAALRAGAKETGDIHCELGNLALERGDGETALREFDAAGTDASLRRNVAIGRASSLNILGRHRESAAAWRAVLAELPDSIPVRVAYAVNLREAGFKEEAIAALEEGVSRSSDARLVDELAYSLAVAGRTAEARALLPRVTDPEVRAEIERP
jgi:tetratricopeptide (TPR) repeat protein